MLSSYLDLPLNITMHIPRESLCWEVKSYMPVWSLYIWLWTMLFLILQMATKLEGSSNWN